LLPQGLDHMKHIQCSQLAPNTIFHLYTMPLSLVHTTRGMVWYGRV